MDSGSGTYFGESGHFVSDNYSDLLAKVQKGQELTAHERLMFSHEYL